MSGSAIGGIVVSLLIAGLFFAWIVWLFVRVFGGSAPRKPPITFATLGGGGGSFGVEVVGESNYLPALQKIAGRGAVRHECTAELWFDDHNRHDKNAVQVRIGGALVGFLNREDAKAYRKQVIEVGHGPFVGRCQAVIVGGGTGRENLGVWLDLPAD